MDSELERFPEEVRQVCVRLLAVNHLGNTKAIQEIVSELLVKAANLAEGRKMGEEVATQDYDLSKLPPLKPIEHEEDDADNPFAEE